MTKLKLPFFPIPSMMRRQAGFIAVIAFMVLGLEFTSFLSIKMLGLHNIPVPWSFIVILSYGFIKPVLISLLFNITVFCGLYFYLLGGIERTIAHYLFVALIAFCIANGLAVYMYAFWEGIHIIPFPWKSYTLFTTLPHNSATFKHFVVCLFVSYVGIALASLGKLFSAQSRAEKVFGAAHFANSFEAKRAGLFSDEGIVIGKAFGKILRLPGFESILVTAPTGGGKTTSIAIPNLLEWSDSGIFNDLKGELFEATAEFRTNVLNNTCYRWSPANKDKNTHRYNPFYYVSKNPDLRVRDLQIIAEILIPSERIDGGFWYTSSRDVFLMLAIYLLETKGMATLSEIHDLSKQEDFFAWLVLSVNAEEINDPVFYQNAHSLLNADRERTAKNILKDFHSRMVLFSDPLVRFATDDNDFDLRQLRREKMSVYINIPDSDKERLRSVLTLFWAQSIHLMTQDEPDMEEEPYSVLALLDEFGNMARINKLKDGTSFFRSYRIRTIVIVQYIAQILSTYGQYDSKGFLNSKVKIAFALNDLDDANFFSRALGTKTVKVKSHGSSMGKHESHSQNVSFQSRALMSPDEVMQMNEAEEIILIEAQPPVRAKKCYWFKERRYNRMLSENEQ